MDKTLIFIYGDNDSEVVSLIHPLSLEKRAQMDESITEFLKNLKPKKDKTYVLINALSAGEYFSSNRNGDYFPEEELIKHHKTFEQYGYLYSHHVNKDPNKSYGKVIFSSYNHKMKRVELVVEIDDKRAPQLVERLHNGEMAAVSMGTKVPFDVCSICGKRSKSRKDYCNHLKYFMNKVLKDGRKVYAINYNPRFFDISIVTIPAEKTAGVIKVLDNLTGLNEEIGEKLAFYENSNYIKSAELENTASICKEIESEDPMVVSKDPKELAYIIKNGPKNMDKATLKKLAEFPFSESLSTLLALRMFPTKQDFQKLALCCFGKEAEAKQLEDAGIVFDDVDVPIIVPEGLSLDNYNEKIAELLLPEVPNLTLTKEFIIARDLIKTAEDTTTELVPQSTQVWPPEVPAERSYLSKLLFNSTPEPKTTSEQNPIIPLGILGSLYYGYSKVFNNTSVHGFRSFMLEHPWLLPVLIGGAAVGSIWAQNKELTKTAGSVDKFMLNSLISFPVSYYLSGNYENKAKQGVPISKTQNLVRKHPALTALVASLVGTKAENAITKLAYMVHKMPDNKKDELYIDVINN